MVSSEYIEPYNLMAWNSHIKFPRPVFRRLIECEQYIFHSIPLYFVHLIVLESSMVVAMFYNVMISLEEELYIYLNLKLLVINVKKKQPKKPHALYHMC